MVKKGPHRATNGKFVIISVDLAFVSFHFQLKRLIKSDMSRELWISERFAAGSMAGAISQTAIYPMEVCTLNIYYTFIYMHYHIPYFRIVL